MATVELRNVRKSFGEHEVIHGINLAIYDREFAAFVGPSGCGKSTLLRMIAGLEQVSAGEVLIDGTPAQDVAPAKRGLAMVFQNYALYPHMTVSENLSFGLRLAGVPKGVRQEKVRAVARILELEPLLDRKPRALSGGQLQRVAIGRAMVRQPRAFLFDEPLSNLDAALQAQMRLELVRLHRQLKTTMIYVTHDQVEAMTMADRIFVLKDGTVEQVGSPLELYENPQTVFVAGFIGAPRMNLLDATPAENAEPQLTLRLSTGAVVHTPFVRGVLGAAEQVQFGIRPEHVTIEADGELRGEVKALEHLGPRTYVHAQLSDRAMLTVQAAGNTVVREGDCLSFHVHAEYCHVFDSSGRRVVKAPEGGGER